MPKPNVLHFWLRLLAEDQVITWVVLVAQHLVHFLFLKKFKWKNYPRQGIKPGPSFRTPAKRLISLATAALLNRESKIIDLNKKFQKPLCRPWTSPGLVLLCLVATLWTLKNWSINCKIPIYQETWTIFAGLSFWGSSLNLLFSMMNVKEWGDSCIFKVLPIFLAEFKAGCFSSGECKSGHDISNAVTMGEMGCLKFCQQTSGCKIFTYHPDNRFDLHNSMLTRSTELA